MKKIVVLTGDRPTGPLHLGHYVGSLLNRVMLQETHEQYVMIADMQALTDNAENPEKVLTNVFEVACDYLAVGIDPQKSTLFLQSMIPAIAELSVIYMNLVTVARVQRNPTVKTEIAQKEFGQSIPLGFFVYPVHQAADITVVKAQLVPVGEDQLPMIEQTNEIVRSFNRIYKKNVLVEAQALVPKCSRLVGIDGQAKMSKSLNNAIYLKDSLDELAKKVRSMYTDPNHLRVEDPGSLEGNTVFNYLDVFGDDKKFIEELKAHYQKGGLGDMKVKNYLLEVLEAKLFPIREKRKLFEGDKAQTMKLLLEGSARVNEIAAVTLHEVKTAMGLNYSDF
ncbi:tryptophan--tRNA ligase [bacterium]|nr:tryptophan--tRNA ligase [bacterium]